MRFFTIEEFIKYPVVTMERRGREKAGSVDDILFDTEQWAVRYFIIDRGMFHSSVLITTPTVEQIDAKSKELVLKINKDSLKEAPEFDPKKPLSRQKEKEIYLYYTYVPYWGGTGYWWNTRSAGSLPVMTGRNETRDELRKTVEEGSSLVQSFTETEGFEVIAGDGAAGEIIDAVCEEDSWVIRYWVVSFEELGDKLISPDWFSEFHWGKGQAVLNLPLESVSKAPDYDPNLEIDRKYEEELYETYKQPKYWP
ncbi:MAG: PRC-barrel domain-containing protein [Spirochaetia bacterium]